MKRPESGEYNPYFETYISKVPAGEFKSLLEKNTLDVIHFFENFPVEKEDFRYQPDKWNVKEIFMHVIDVERVMQFRALAASRKEPSPLPIMDDHLYLANSGVESKSMRDLLDEFIVVRNSTTKFFEFITSAQSEYRIHAAGFPSSVRALGYIIIGHVIHHINVIKEKYI